MFWLMNKKDWMSRQKLYLINQQLVNPTTFWIKRCKVMQWCCMSLEMLDIKLVIGPSLILRLVKNNSNNLLLAKRLVNIKIKKIKKDFSKIKIWIGRILTEKNQMTKNNHCIMMLLLENNLKKKNILEIKKSLINNLIKKILKV